VSPAAVSACLSSHPWLAQVHAGNNGALLLLSASGHAELRRYGRQSLLDHLQAHLAAHAIEPAQYLRLIDTATDDLDPSTIDRRLQSPRPDHVTLLAEHAQDEVWTLTLQLPLELIHFDGHFPQAPVLPGVLQVGWALAMAAPRLGTSMHCREMEALKFQRLLHPGDRIQLTLRFEADAQESSRGKLHFAYRLDGEHCSSGRLRVERA
jgi:3-hydroxymyristoyl/3-hydroxydecanoyl-(acyl carrier protein) dehydratase